MDGNGCVWISDLVTCHERQYIFSTASNSTEMVVLLQYLM